LGGGILVAWRAQLAGRCNPLLRQLDEHTWRFGLTLEPHWRLIGALEGMDGMLLFGISTAYIFAIMQTYWSLMIRGRPD
jgi:hypothetical protein